MLTRLEEGLLKVVARLGDLLPAVAFHLQEARVNVLEGLGLHMSFESTFPG